MLLPSQRDWLTQCLEYLLDGELLIVRGLPRTGKTFLVEAILRELPDTAVIVRGRQFTEENQIRELERLIAEIEGRVAQHGLAQIVFDDYSAALRLSRGGRLQARLYSALVDSEHSRDVGALLLSRWKQPIHLKRRGSPLVSRARFLCLPTISQWDLDETRMRAALDDVCGLIGPLASYFARANGASLPQLASSIEQGLRPDVRHLVKDMPAEALEFLAGARAYSALNGEAQESLMPFLFQDGEKVRLTQAANRAGLLGAVEEVAPGWPSDLRASAQRFIELASGWEDVLWCDRYLYQNPEMLVAFLIQVRTMTAKTIKLLAAPPLPGTGRSISDLGDALQRVTNVEARIMNRLDYRALHDRHLLSLDDYGGFVLPTCRVIFAVDAPGSAVAAPVNRFGIDYKDYWRRAQRLN